VLKSMRHQHWQNQIKKAGAGSPIRSGVGPKIAASVADYPAASVAATRRDVYL
jgi:hypothetical protein